MITTAIAVGTDGTVILGAGPTYGILLAILIVHGIVCSSATRILARLNLFYGFLMSRCNPLLSVTRRMLNCLSPLIHQVGATVGAIVALLVCSGTNKVSTRTAFGMFENNTGWKNGLIHLACT